MTRARGSFWRSGGWVVAGAIVLVTTVITWHTTALLKHRRSHAIGDGRNPQTYGLPLSPNLLPADAIVASGLARDGLPALTDPPSWRPEQLLQEQRQRHSKLLVTTDRVVGVVRNGQARAYPLRFLQWHEVVNDTLGRVPIAVTYSPLCDSVVVFDRRSGGQVRTFGVSGLLYNSNLLLYDRQLTPSAASLWSQLQRRAVTGNAAAASLTLDVLPAAVVTWAWWRQLHPDTSVLALDPRLAAQYEREPYSSYFGSDLLRFPVTPMPPPSGERLKEPLVAVLVGGAWHAFTFAQIAAHAGAEGVWRLHEPSATLTFSYRPSPPVVLVTGDDDAALPVIYSFRFAWFATQAGLPVRD